MLFIYVDLLYAPYATAAHVGSEKSLILSKPAIVAASNIAYFYESVEKPGTPITTLVIVYFK